MTDRYGHGRNAARLVVCIFGLAGCTGGSDGEGDPGPLGNCPPGQTCGFQPGLGDAASPITFDSGFGGFGGGVGFDGGAVTTPWDASIGFVDGGVVSPDASQAPGVPCDVAAVVSKHCASCHMTPLAFGAPMPLLTLADFQAASFSTPTKKVHEQIPGRLMPTDTNRKMPPTSKPSMSAAVSPLMSIVTGSPRSNSLANASMRWLAFTASPMTV